MQGEFLDKFKGKTNKVPKQGVHNLLDHPHKNNHKSIKIKHNQSKPHDKEKIHHTDKSKPHQNDKQKKSKRKKQHKSPSNKQNKKIHTSQSKPKLKKIKEHSVNKNLQTNKNKQISKNRQILGSKQNGKHTQVHGIVNHLVASNVSKVPLKLPKISKQNKERHQQHSLTQMKNHSYIHQKDKHKKSILTESRQIQIQRHEKQPNIKNQRHSIQRHDKHHERHHTMNEKSQKHQYNTLQSLLDQQAMIQLRRLNQFQVIIRELQIKKQLQKEQQQMLLQRSRHYKKGNTLHY